MKVSELNSDELTALEQVLGYLNFSAGTQDPRFYSNLNLIWKGPVYLLSRDTLYGYSANRFQEKAVKVPRFRRVVERMRESEKPFTL